MSEIGGGWGVVARAYGVRPVALVEEAVYRWFARNRTRFHRFGVRPDCEEAGSDCE